MSKRNEKFVPSEAIFQVQETGTYLGTKELMCWLLSHARLGDIVALADMMVGQSKDLADLGSVKRVV
ncbi:hypothetical protein NP1_15 [Xanthomonas phage NP1]|nr:hypothetical protein NP1_15 [Xanthomonas phage NP1]